jgi:hypothetical protein
VKVVQRDAQLFEVVAAGAAAGSFASGLHRRQEQRHEHPDDGNHDEQLDERECRPRR